MAIGAAFLGGLAAHLGAETVARPLFSTIHAQLKPWELNASFKAWWDNPFVLPEPGMLLDMLSRGVGDAGQIQRALRSQGINYLSKRGGPVDDATYDLWYQAGQAMLGVPDVGVVLDAWMRGLLPDEQRARSLMRRAGGDWERMIESIPWRWDQPGSAEVADAWARGRIDDAEYRIMLQQSGGDYRNTDYFNRTLVTPPPLGDAIEGIRRGILHPSLLPRFLQQHRLKDPESEMLYTELLKGIPQVADLVMMGIREAFRPELAQVYDYYSEFPELTRPWFAKLGLNYPVGIPITPKEGAREATLADLYWAAHWHPMPLGQAYAAYQRFRPDQIARYQRENPDLKPFTRDDLILHMRIADLPPGVRDWMVALGHQPLGVRGIQWGVQFLRKDVAWATERYLDLGYVLDDAQTQAQIQIARNEQRDRAWITSLEQAANKKLVALTESLYRDGLIDRDQATRRLTQMGIPELSAIQLLDLQELQVKHTLIVSAVAATRRAFLSGEILAADVPTQLGRFGVLPFRASLYLQTWQIQFTQKRKRLETGKIAAMVVEGLMSAADAKQRLGNLGWSDPDATLLLAEAAGKVHKREAAEAKAGESAAQRRARELERLAKAADAQARKLRSEANRVAPRSVLMRWAKEHEIGEDSFRSMMRERGYPEGDIDLYWQEVVTPKPRAPRPAPTVRPFPRPPGSAHPTEAMLGKWYLTETIGRTEYVDALQSLGYSAGDAERIAYNDDLKHGAKGTTREPPAPAPPT